MSKRAVLLHGTDGSPIELPWQAWLKQQLEADGYEVYFPQLPECHTPDLAVYDKFLKGSGLDFSDNIVIGHSSGATTALHLLQQAWFPHVKATVLVGTFLDEKLVKNASWYDPGQFDNLFVDELDLKVLKQKSDAFYFVHGDDDPYCDYSMARQLSTQLGGKFITLPGAGHIAKSSGVAKMPELTEALERDGIVG